MKAFKRAAWVIAVSGFSVMITACAGNSVCRNDACYDRKISSVDPYRKGEIATWGTEQEVFEEEESREFIEHRIKSLRGE